MPTIRRRLRDALAKAAAVSNLGGVQATYVGNDRLIVKLPANLHVVAVASDLSLTPELVTRGMYDRPFWNFLRRALREGDHAVDVGANIGLFTVAMAARVGPDGHVTAYEPDAVMAQLVSDNVLSNWAADRVTVVQAAAGRESGTLTFARHPRFLGSSSAGTTDFAGHAVRAGYESVTVPVERLDQRVQGHVRLVKIDVEGGEDAVLEGATGVTADLWDIEVLLDMAHDEARLVELLRELPGSPHVHKGNGTLRAITFDEVLRLRNLPHVVFAEPEVVRDSGLA